MSPFIRFPWRPKDTGSVHVCGIRDRHRDPKGCRGRKRSLAFDSLRLSTTEEPAYDLSRFAFRTDGFRLEPDVKDLKAGRVIGHLVIIDPNDATLKAMDDYTSDWNRRVAREGGAELAWQRDAGGVNVWRSVRMVFLIEKAGQNRSFTGSPLNDGAPYEKLYPEWSDAQRRDRLFTYGDLEDVGPWLVPSWIGIARWFLPDYAGLLTFETEMIETYREDGSPTGCLPVDRADRKD